MADVESILDSQLKQLNRSVLNHGGVVKTAQAKARAHEQYAIFNDKRKAVRQARAEAELADLKAQAKTLPKARKPRAK